MTMAERKARVDKFKVGDIVTVRGNISYDSLALEGITTKITSVWNEDEEAAYVLECKKDGSTVCVWESELVLAEGVEVQNYYNAKRGKHVKA